MTGIQNNSGLSKIKDDLSFPFISLSHPCDEVVLLWETARTNSCHRATESWVPRSLLPCCVVIIKTLPSTESLRMRLHGVYIPAYRIGGGESMTQSASTQVPFEPQRPKPTWSHLAVKKTWKYSLYVLCLGTQQNNKNKSERLLDNGDGTFCCCLQGCCCCCCCC